MGTPPLFLLDPLPTGATFDLTGDEGRHAAKVRRLTVGEVLSVSDGRGTVADCVVTAARPDGLGLTVRARRSEPAPQPRIVVIQALPKGDRAELAVEVLTELGADEIVPWAASRSVVQWHGARGERAREKWQATAREAAKQSRRARVPVVAPLASTVAVATQLAGATALVLHESAAVRLAGRDLVNTGEGHRDVVIVVGPEGGISDDELALFAASGAVAVRLGSAVLRTSTAGAAALAVVSVQLGRWG